jgi:hypothetical protein
MELIHGDIIRTTHRIAFIPSADRNVYPQSTNDHVHMRRIERILDLFAQLNPTIFYLQGFTKLMTVRFSACYSAPCYFNDDELEVEGLSFYTFQEIFGVDG